ncbi:hypothetical protein F2Q70_00012295 [Brassica cretica]|uniref:Uncharacterized protein n=1 Tax=Brassica cretica TaxID=69181 RepID=A0A8S9M6W2_BRACR|nr:hypothetical protein F2Q70_00012295 [Brassica cretica]
MTRASSPGEHDRVAGRLAGELGRDTSQLARRARPCCRSTRRRARPRHEPARPASTTVLPVDSPASSAATRASSPGEHDRVAGRLAGELGRKEGPNCGQRPIYGPKRLEPKEWYDGLSHPREEINVKFPKIITKKKKIWKSPLRDKSGPRRGKPT